MEQLLPFVWVLIPLAAIAVGAFKEWLKFKAKQDRLGTSTAELERAVEDLRSELQDSFATRDRLQQRVENLETIVTTEMWDVVHGTRTSQPEPTPKPQLEVRDAEEELSDRAARMAAKLRNM